MNQTLKRILSVVLILFTVFAWYITIFGIGKMEPVKDKLNLGLDIKGGVYVVMEAQTDEMNLSNEELVALMEQTKSVMENRVYEMGFSEAVVTIEGSNRLRIELPGAEDAEEAIEQIGQVAQLQFILADGTLVVDGGNVKDAKAATSETSTGYVVHISFDSEGAKLFEDGTRKAYNGEVTSSIEGVDDRAIAIVLDGNIITAPTVQSVISGGNCEITGSYSSEEASNLAALIRGGSLPVSLVEITSSTQTASIGHDALEKSVYAGIIGFILIFIVMIAAYRAMGIIADIALLLYVIMIIWAMAFSGSTLTLPGIAGIILGVGMAVDANVIIFSRIREEIANGKSVRTSCSSGFKRALSAILDAQITTLIAGVVLYEVGSAVVKGFAVTLMLGIIASIITGVLITKLYLTTFVDLKEHEPKKSLFGVREDGTCTFGFKKFFNVLKNRKLYYIISAAVIVVGLLIGCVRGFNYGIDFTGGTTMTVEMGQQVDLDQVEDVLDKFEAEDVTLIYGGTGNTQVIMKTTTFFDNAARGQIFDALQAEFGCSDDALIASEQFGPAVGDELKVNALKAVLIAAIAMLIYIVIRFRRVQFGISALIGVFHDVLLVMAFYGLFHITINNPFIAGILTVVGYSINDTIVIFDRIRENIGLLKKKDLTTVVDTSINQVLGRSIMTSVTTLIVMIPMYIMVSVSIREFILPLMVGVIVGCASSIFICSPVYHDLTKLFEKKKYKGGSSSDAPKKDKPKDYGGGAVV